MDDHRRSSPEVLIVGAGPVGLALGCDLLQQQVDLRVVDMLAGATREDAHSRAILLVPRVLELLTRIGVSDDLVDAGTKVPVIGYYSGGRLLGRARFADLPDTRFPFVLALPQRTTEEVLRRRFVELGGSVEPGRLRELDSGSPSAVVEGPDGKRRRVDPDWLIGADGAGSTTRALLGLGLSGDPTDVTYLIADAPVEGAPKDQAQYYYSRHGLLAVIPMGGGLFRMAGNVPHDEPGGAGRWRTLLQEAVDRRATIAMTVGEPTYARLVRPRCGRAPQLRTGRCFLAGDAAHVITPAGGQGMNLGLQDAANLGWKLGGVIRGSLPEEVLQGYHAERSAAAARTAAMTARLVGLAQRHHPVSMALRDAGFAVAERTGLVQRLLTPLLSQLDVDYAGAGEIPPRAAGPARPAAPGRRLPIPVALLPDHTYAAVLWPGRRVPRDWSGQVSRMRRELASSTAVIDATRLSPDDRTALSAVLGSTAELVMVRPDGHVVRRVPLRRSAELAAWCRARLARTDAAGAASGAVTSESAVLDPVSPTPPGG